MKLKSKLLVSASTLALAGAGIGMAAPAAHAVVTSGGQCSNTVLFAKISTPVKGVGLGDQTTNSVKVAGNLAKDQTTKLAVNGGGSCTGTFTRPGDLHVPNGANPTLTPKSQATVLLGNASCASGANDIANDATKANAWPLNGKITWTFNQTYTDLVTALVHPYKMQADIAVMGFNAAAGPDVVDIAGIVLIGADAGFNVGGNIWEDPVAKTGGATGYNTGYEIDLVNAAGCADDTTVPAQPGEANDANITMVLSGGGATTPSLLGSTATGITFQAGE